jgi:hypothetical protein
MGRRWSAVVRAVEISVVNADQRFHGTPNPRA